MRGHLACHPTLVAAGRFSPTRLCRREVEAVVGGVARERTPERLGVGLQKHEQDAGAEAITDKQGQATLPKRRRERKEGADLIRYCTRG